jgi:hypothetical protein
MKDDHDKFVINVSQMIKFTTLNKLKDSILSYS